MNAVVIAGYGYWAGLLVGMVLVLATLRRHPRRSVFAAIGLVVLLIVAVLQNFVFPVYSSSMFSLDSAVPALVAFTAVAVFKIVGLLLVITALVVRERAAPHVGPPGAWPAPPPVGQWPGGSPFPPGPAGRPAPGWPPPGPPQGGRRP